jgi:hypothetical protein
MLHEEALPAQARVGADYQWATLNQDVWIGGHKFPAGTKIVVSLSQTATTGGGKAHTTSIGVKVWVKFGQSFDSSSWLEGTVSSSMFTLTGQSATWGNQGFGAPPHMGGGGHRGGGGFRHRGGGFRHRGLRRHHFGGRGFVDWPWWWGPEVIIEPASCTWMPYPIPVPPNVVATLARLPWQTRSDGSQWRSAFVAAASVSDVGGWVAERASPHAYYVCVVADSLVTGFYGLGMEYTENPKPGDYHVNGNGIVLRAAPSYTSKAIATLQKGENVYVFGDVETDPEWKVLQNDTVVKNDGEVAGIDYVRVGTQTHGAGWVGMLYIDPGAGAKFGAPTPQPSPTPTTTPAPLTKPEGMGLISKVLLGGAIVATVAGGAFLIGKAVSESRPRRLAHA